MVMWILDQTVGEGRQVWRPVHNAPVHVERAAERARSLFRENIGEARNSADRIYRIQCQEQLRAKGIELPRYSSPAPTAQEAARRGVRFYETLQMDDGHWPGDYGGPMFLLPGLVITCYITGTPLSDDHRFEMIRYLSNHQYPDGGWGLHIEGQPTMFGTALNYVALRILGVKRDDKRAERARQWIMEHGGATSVPSWGKFWLATLGVYDWEGLNPVPPELWVAPYWLPLFAGRMWCHCRVVYLPMGYIYGKRHTAAITPLIESLREELYTQPYSDIDWVKQRNNINEIDLYTPHSKLLKFVNKLGGLYEKYAPRFLRDWACRECMDHIHHEDETTKYIDIGPVNKAINMLAVWYDNPNGEAFRKHQERIVDYLWLAEDGMKMQGYNGSQLWDTAFAMQAIVSTGLEDEFRTVVQKSHDYVNYSQVQEDVDNNEHYYRHISKGGWPFSTRDHGWPISDCTAEGLKAALVGLDMPWLQDKLSPQRFYDGVNVILSFQNPNGGWATYENTRDETWLEALNPSEVYGDIMIDYTYVECSSACVQALSKFAKKFPNHRTKEVQHSIDRGIRYIRSIQRADGSWIGSWGVCFTYGCWFGMEALAAAGYSYEDDDAVRRCCDFVVSKQRSDGSWGESYLSCVDREYRENKKSGQVVNTAWALLSLMLAKYPHRHVIDGGIRYLIQMQQRDGDWAQEDISGVFNMNCMITYANYRNIFPIWALGHYTAHYEK